MELKGSLSLHWQATEEQLKRGEVEVHQFNLVFPGVRQSAITGKEPKSKQNVGLLGMSVPVSRTKVRLRYDPQNQTATGEIPVQVHFPQLDEIFPPEFVKGRESDFAVSRTQRGRVKLELKFATPLDKAASDAAQSRKEATAMARASARIEVEPLQAGGAVIAGYQFDFREFQIPLRIAPLFIFEVARRLCVQPVRIRNNASDASPTGAGLAFGMPGANTQWGKADITFNVRSWMTVTNAALKVATEGAEEDQIRASVDVGDCIEVFFVENFSPVSLHGGGATWSSGTAAAKIISSDGNATFGVDLTHLAHELGHVLSMGHPGNPFGLFDPSTNSLMCPSGWHNDNPKRNSQDNANNAANPLLRFAIKLRGPGPDCNSSGDCGACP